MPRRMRGLEFVFTYKYPDVFTLCYRLGRGDGVLLIMVLA
jgi:hypothetical protein